MSSPEAAADATEPKVLIVYYTFTQQSLKLAEAMEGVFRERGCEVQLAAIEFTDPRYVERFSHFPFSHAFLDVLAMLPAQLRRATGEIRIPDEAKGDGYDLVCIGSPTWWLTTNMPIRSFLKSDSTRGLLAGTRFAGIVPCRRYWRNNLNTVRKLGTEQGGQWVDGIHFTYEGGQARSLLSLISYLGSGEYRDRFLGLRIPPTNLKPAQLDQVRAFAGALGDRLGVTATNSATGSPV